MTARPSATSGWSDRWVAEREAPIWICTGGPHDAKPLPTSQRAGVYRDHECEAAGGVYRLAQKKEGRFVVPTAIWTPITPQSGPGRDINTVGTNNSGEF